MELKMWKKINQESEKLYLNCINKNLTITTAESCTGGMISSAIVHIKGSSQIFKSSVIVYSNDMKSKFLDIPKDLIAKNGAVSEIIALKMASSSLKIIKAELSIAVTGIAGPTGGSKDKPIGLVWISIATKNKNITKIYACKCPKR